MTNLERTAETANNTKHEPIDVRSGDDETIIIEYTFGNFIAVSNEGIIVNIEGHGVLCTGTVRKAVEFFNEYA